MTGRLFSLPALGALMTITLLAACAGPQGHGLASLTAKPKPAEALVRFQKLAATHPRLAEFEKSHGTPDFTQETRGAQGAALMLYYLKPGKAWLCVMKHGSAEATLLGPEPIGTKELNFLRAAKALEE